MNIGTLKMSEATEHIRNQALIRKCKEELQRFSATLMEEIKKGSISPPDAAAYNKIAESIFYLAAGAAVATRASRTQIAELAAIKDEVDTIISWNTASRP